jgi:hypothetical protein
MGVPFLRSIAGGVEGIIPEMAAVSKRFLTVADFGG